MKKTSNFKDRIYAIAAKIPKGKVATYGQLAKIAGRPNAARAVGNAMRTNTDTKAVPCHRVVGATGALTGYAYGNGLTTKMSMLKREGVAFKGERVDLTTSGWKG
jgi:methylated-DNA-protein-cysteine methyltransferase-like protein